MVHSECICVEYPLIYADILSTNLLGAVLCHLGLDFSRGVPGCAGNLEDLPRRAA